MSRQSKGWMSVVLLLCILLTACSTNTNAKSSSGRPKLIVYVSGMGAKLSNSDIAQNGGYGFDSVWNTIQSYLHGTDEFASASSLTFSYFGSTDDGKPMTFTCDETFNNALLSDVSLLKIQINGYLLKHPHTDVYIISHSLGGVIAFSFLAELVEKEHNVSLLNDGKLMGVSINDSPLGGVTSDPGYIKSLIAKAFTCNLSGEQYTSIGELRTLFDTSSSADPRGGNASVLSAFLQGRNISNQNVATDAANMGLALIVIGNENDLLWRPEACGIGSDFLSTQYLTEVGKQRKGAVFVRSFTSGLFNCAGLLNTGNHVDVLNRSDVGKAIWETFTGRTLDQLKKVTVAPTPTQAVFTRGTWENHDVDIINGEYHFLLTVTDIKGSTFSGTLWKNTNGFGATFMINGSITSSTDSSVGITFTEGKDLIGTQTDIRCTYTATVSNGQMNGNYSCSDGTGGTFSLTKTS